jgi:hypothetical protein
MAKFKVNDVFFFPRIKRDVIVGHVLSGEITKGMFLQKDPIILKIISIEQTDEKVDGKWLSSIGLMVASRSYSKEELEKLVGTVVDVNKED